MSKYKIETTDLGQNTMTYSIKSHDDRELATITIANSPEGVELKEWIKYALAQRFMIDEMLRVVKIGAGEEAQ